MTPADRAEITQSIMTALRDGEHMLSGDETRWVRLAIKKEAQSIEFRDFLIKMTLTGLAGAFLTGIGYILSKFAASIGLKL